MNTILILLGVLAALAILAPRFTTTFIPGPLDERSRMETALTKTASFVGNAFDQGVGWSAGGPGRAMSAVIKATALDLVTGDETYKATLQESDDNATWTDASAAGSIVKVGAMAVHGFVSKRYVRASLVLAGTTPSITYDAWLVAHQ